MYGSSFCIRTLRPRCSSSMPIEALVSPLPSELTTPPVTKICLVINHPEKESGRLYAKSCCQSRLGERRQSHFAPKTPQNQAPKLTSQSPAALAFLSSYQFNADGSAR